MNFVLIMANIFVKLVNLKPTIKELHNMSSILFMDQNKIKIGV
jgi:hypothetical protein